MSPALLWLLALRSAVAVGTSPVGPGVSIEVDPCARLQPELFSRLAEIEFGDMLRQDHRSPFVTKVHVGCDGEGRILLTVNDPITGKESTRTLQSRDLPERTRERLVVLAVYELVTASWVELELHPQPAIPPASPAVPQPLKEAARETARQGMAEAPPARKWEIGFGGFSRVYPSGVLGVYGGALSVEHLPLYWFGWRAEVDLGGGFHDRDGVGRVGALDTSGAAFLLAYGSGRRLRFDIALGARVGAWRLAGAEDPDTGFQGRTATFAWFGPAAAAGLVIYPGPRVGIRLGLEAGVLLRRTDLTTEAGNTVLRLQGAWLRPALMAEVRL